MGGGWWGGMKKMTKITGRRVSRSAVLCCADFLWWVWVGWIGVMVCVMRWNNTQQKNNERPAGEREAEEERRERGKDTKNSQDKEVDLVLEWSSSQLWIGRIDCSTLLLPSPFSLLLLPFPSPFSFSSSPSSSQRFVRAHPPGRRFWLA